MFMMRNKIIHFQVQFLSGRRDDATLYSSCGLAESMKTIIIYQTVQNLYIRHRMRPKGTLHVLYCLTSFLFDFVSIYYSQTLRKYNIHIYHIQLSKIMGNTIRVYT